MTTLRERLIALADDAPCCTEDRGTFHALAVAAAKLAYEDAAGVCDEIDAGEEDADDLLFGSPCAAAIRARAAELVP